MSTITEQLGRVLGGRYRLEEAIGTGSSAHVYAAVDVVLDRVVAVKVLHPALALDHGFQRRFRAEARSVAALSHPHVVQVHDWGVERDGPYLVLEHLGGGSLADLLDDGQRLSVPMAARIGAEVARGLAYAHRRGLVHRDVKPANLLFDDEGAAKIADFGLARALAEAGLTEPAGAHLGTARYASPEQAEGLALDDRSDVYSLAVVLYEAVVGRAPFTGETAFATLVARVGATLPASPELGPLAPILAQAAICEPLARLDAAELASELELLASGLPAPGVLQRSRRALPAHGHVRPSHFRPEPGARAGDPVGVPRARPAPFDQAAAGRAPFDQAPFDQAAADPGAVDRGSVRSGEPGAARATRRLRRPLRVLGAVLGALVLLAAAGAGVLRFAVYSHVVPRLVAKSAAAAGMLAREAGVREVVAGLRYSERVPGGEVISQSPAPGGHVRYATVVRVVLSKGLAPVEVPSVLAGRPLRADLSTLEAAGLRPRVRRSYEEQVPAGRVVAALPSSGLVPARGIVTLVVSDGPAPRTIPQLGSDTWAGAEQALIGLRLVPIEQLSYSDTIPAGDVVSSSPAMGTTGVDVGSRVEVTVSRGPQEIAVPSVAGLSISAAIATLEHDGLQVAEQVGPPFATQASTTAPAPGTAVLPGTSVTLYVS